MSWGLGRRVKKPRDQWEGRQRRPDEAALDVGIGLDLVGWGDGMNGEEEG